MKRRIVSAVVGSLIILGLAAGPASALTINHPVTGASDEVLAPNDNNKGPNGDVGEGNNPNNPIQGAWEATQNANDNSVVDPEP